MMLHSPHRDQTSPAVQSSSAVGLRPLEQGDLHPSNVQSSHVGQPLSPAHRSTSEWPPSAAPEHVHMSHGQPLARAHWSTARWPPSADSAHVHASHGQPLARAHWSTSRWPPLAALAHVCVSHGQPLEHAHWSTASHPCCKLLAPVLLLVPLLRFLFWWTGGAHPGGAHEATGNEANAVDMAEHHFHQLRHQFLHHLLLVLPPW
jgi:hypothetical protein